MNMLLYELDRREPVGEIHADGTLEIYEDAYPATVTTEEGEVLNVTSPPTILFAAEMRVMVHLANGRTIAPIWKANDKTGPAELHEVTMP